MVNEDYLHCSSYEGQAKHPTEKNFVSFNDSESKLYFFALVDADGAVLLKSEGYPQEASRENGIQSVIKNRMNREFYSVKGEPGNYHLSLRAANYREIARSCHFATEAEALAQLPYVTGEQVRQKVVTQTVAATTTSTASTGRRDDDYLACHFYENQPTVGSADGIVKFTHSNGKHYFAWYDDDNHLLMRSEGYPTTAARDNGAESVLKNRDLEERYGVEEKLGYYFTYLKAGNHQEIARACGKKTLEAAIALYPSKRAEALRLSEEAAKQAVVDARFATHGREDDYLACREYENHGAADGDGFTKWQHSNGQYYFTLLNANGSVRLRSEGYPSEVGRDGDLAKVLEHLHNKDSYKIKEVAGRYFVMMYDGDEEIARSCPYSSETAIYSTYSVFGVHVPEVEVPHLEVPAVAVATAAVAAAIPHVELPKVEVPHVELPKVEVPHVDLPKVEVPHVELPKVEIPTVAVAAAAVAAAVPHIEIPKVEVPKVEMPKVEVPHLDVPHVTVPHIEIPKVVVETPKVEVPKVVAGAAAAATVAAAAAITHKKEEVKVETKKATVHVPPPVVETPVVEVATPSWISKNWWWLLGLLLLPLLWMLFGKGCNAEAPKVEAPVVQPIPVETPKPVVAEVPKVVAPSCDLHWIYFDYDKSDLRPESKKELDHLATLLTENKGSVADLRAFTDGNGTDEYNAALSKRRATAARNYLLNVKKIAASQVKEAAEGKKDPIAQNTTDDSGRKFNRRVELYLQDKDGKNICQSVQPEIPATLKQ